MNTLTSTIRRYDIDWLRVFAVLLLIPFHTARIFDVWEANYVKNADLSAALTYGIVGFLNQWHMPLFFLLAGASTWFALGFRSGAQYAKERLLRLFVPLVFGVLVVVPPQAYLARFQTPGYSASYLQFLPDYFRIRGDLSGYTGLFTPAHLWFILFLFIDALIALPLFLYLRRDNCFTTWLAAFCEKPGALFLFALVPWLASATPDIGGKNILFFLVIFVAGFILVADVRFSEILDRNKRVALILGTISMAITLALYAAHLEFARFSIGDILFSLLRMVDMWSWLIALLGYGKQYLNFSNRLLKYASEAAYPFYILHQTVIIVIGYFVVQWDMNLYLKFLVIVTSSLISTVLIYDLFIRRINIMRFLFGMKPLAKKPLARPAQQPA